MAYFFVSVSNRINLELCKKYALAGFTNSINGVWTFSEIQEGDFISFLYGARAHNLYRIEYKEAIRDAEGFPPWDTITFKMSGKTYYFPFRLHLSQIREYNESLVRTEFAYVAENLLLRGGYRKTHFQADQTTLQNASQLGELYKGVKSELKVDGYKTFTPLFAKSNTSPPEIFRFIEVILQAAIRQYLSDKNNLIKFLHHINVNSLQIDNLDVLGEKALAEGHIDIMIKEAVPIGLARKIVLEVKTGIAKLQDINQLVGYMNELGDECLAGVLVAKSFSKKLLYEAKESRINTFAYKLDMLESGKPASFNEIKDNLKLINVS